jgi:hypothetical protein
MSASRLNLLPSAYVFTLVILFLLASCADYETGYEHGYNNINERNWLIAGKDEYKRGIEQGRIQAFQDDWYSESADEIVVAKACPVALIRPKFAIFTEVNGFVNVN